MQPGEKREGEPRAQLLLEELGTILWVSGLVWVFGYDGLHVLAKDSRKESGRFCPCPGLRAPFCDDTPIFPRRLLPISPRSYLHFGAYHDSVLNLIPAVSDFLPRTSSKSNSALHTALP